MVNALSISALHLPPPCARIGSAAAVLPIPRRIRHGGRVEGDAGELWEARLSAVAIQRDRTAFAELFSHFAPRIKAVMIRGGMAADMAEAHLRSYERWFRLAAEAGRA